MTFRMYPRRLLDENRWRASRYGIDGKLIDFGRSGKWRRELLHEMLEFIAPEVDELGSHGEIAHIENIYERYGRGPATGGLGADAQSQGRGRSHRARDIRRAADRCCALRKIRRLEAARQTLRRALRS